MERTHAALGGTAHVTTAASLGFCMERADASRPAATFTLAEQTHHKAAFLRQRCFAPHRLPVVVAGHSIGHYMALRAVRDLESASAANRADQAAAAGRCASSGAPLPPVAVGWMVWAC